MPRVSRVGSAREFAVRYALVGALLASWALGIGRYGGPDEPAHVLRSFAAAHGDVLGDAADPLPPGYRVVSVPAALASGDPSCYRHDARLTSACAVPDIGEFAAVDDSQRIRAATSAGLTPPLYHLMIGTIVRLVGDPADTAWYRLVAALVHAVVVALALVRAACSPRAGVDGGRHHAGDVVPARRGQPELARDRAGAAGVGGCRRAIHR